MRFQGGSWQTILAGCQPQRQFGVLLLLAPAVALRWGLEKTALFWNPEPRGKLELRVEIRVPIGNSDVTVKYATVHSWVPYLTAEAWNRILFEIRKKECIGLNFRKCPNDEIWEMANVHNKGSGRRPKTWVIQNHVGDITGKKLREKGLFLVGSQWTTPAPPQCYSGTFLRALDRGWLPDVSWSLLHYIPCTYSTNKSQHKLSIFSCPRHHYLFKSKFWNFGTQDKVPKTDLGINMIKKNNKL